MSALSIFGLSPGGMAASVLYILALYGCVSFFVVRHKKADKIANWTPLESVAVTLFIYFFSQLFVGLLLYGVLGVAGWNESRIADWFSGAVIGQFVLMCCIQIVTVGLLAFFLRRRKATFQSIGFIGRPKWDDLGRAVVGYLAYMTFYIVVAMFIDRFLPVIDLDQKQQIGYDQVSSLQLPLVLISLVVLPPLVEELVVRGFLYTGLKRRLPVIYAAILTSFVFAIAHLQAGSSAPLLWVAAIDTFILSMVLIKLREQTGNLWAPILLHALKNFVAFLGLFVFRLV